MEPLFEIDHLAADPTEEWQRMLRFANLNQTDRQAMAGTAEVLLRRASELVVSTYDTLRTIPETAAILGWESGVDEHHLEERRRFFTIWLARTIGIDLSSDFGGYLFIAGKYHAGYGPRRIHTPTSYVSVSIGLVLSAFARFMLEAGLPVEKTAPAMGAWSKYLTVQLNQMNFGYAIAREYHAGDYPVQVGVYGRMRPIIGQAQVSVPAWSGASVADLLRKFFNYYPQARSEALERVWHSEEKADSMWVELKTAYTPKPGWRFLLNGRDLDYGGGFALPVNQNDEIAIFPPGR